MTPEPRVDQRVRMFRRRALLAAMASSPMACHPRGRQRLAAASGAPAGGDRGGLPVATTGPMRDGERGGTAVVLLHGWGASGDDLVPLAHALEHPRTRFFLPAAPLAEQGGGRAWWHLDAPDRPAFASGDQPPPRSEPHPALGGARSAVQAVLRAITERHAPEALMLAGFSQGAMLALDVALAAAPPVDRVAALSGVLMADSIPALLSPRSSRPPVLLSHGRQDGVVPFAGGELVRTLLERHGFTVTWRPFAGGHEIPPAILEELRGFLFGGA
jgi:phospholipase/carboxylesterase